MICGPIALNAGGCWSIMKSCSPTNWDNFVPRLITVQDINGSALTRPTIYSYLGGKKMLNDTDWGVLVASIKEVDDKCLSNCSNSVFWSAVGDRPLPEIWNQYKVVANNTVFVSLGARDAFWKLLVKDPKAVLFDNLNQEFKGSKITIKEFTERITM